MKFWTANKVRSVLPPGWMLDEFAVRTRRKRNERMRAARREAPALPDYCPVDEYVAENENGTVVTAPTWGDLVDSIWRAECSVAQEVAT